MAVFNEKLHVDLLSSDDIIALQIMDVFSTYFLLMPVRPEMLADWGVRTSYEHPVGWRWRMEERAIGRIAFGSEN